MILITSTTDIMITSSITDYPSSSYSINIDVTTVANNSVSSKPPIAYTVIASSVAGALLVLCFVGCTVGLLLKRKLNRKQKDNTISPVNSLFYKYVAALARTYFKVHDYICVATLYTQV